MLLSEFSFRIQTEAGSVSVASMMTWNIMIPSVEASP